MASPYPVILSIENHCGERQQQKMADLFVSVFGEALYRPELRESEGVCTGLRAGRGRLALKGRGNGALGGMADTSTSLEGPALAPATPAARGRIRSRAVRTHSLFCEGQPRGTTTADRRQPPTAANRQPPPTAANRHQPPTAVRHCFCVSCPCLGHEAEHVPVTSRSCWRFEPFFVPSRIALIRQGFHWCAVNSASQTTPPPADASEGKGPLRRPQQRLGRRLKEVAKAVGGSYCRLQMPLRLALGVRKTVAGHRLGGLEGGGD